MNKKNVLVSIAMATYNGDKYLQKQLDSIVNQTYANLEIIICDDCSYDSTVEIIRNYMKVDKRIQLYLNENNLGYVKNFEKSLSLCSGEYIALSDQDDIWEVNKIETLVANIGDTLLIHSNVSLIDENDNLLRIEWKKSILEYTEINDFLFSNVVTGCSTMISKKLLQDALPFPDGLAYHDWYLALCAIKSNSIKFVDIPLLKYRQHASQDTGAISPNKYLLLVLDPLKRLFSGKNYRMIGASKQLKNLQAVYYSKHFQETKEDIKEVIEYFEDYLKHYIHIKMFKIGCKYVRQKYKVKLYSKKCISMFLHNLLG